MEERMTYDIGELRIEWRQSICGSVPLDTWHAYVISPVQTLNFGYVARSLRGRWFVSVCPGCTFDSKSYHAPYATPEKGMAHMMRWASYHWRKFPQIQDCRYVGRLRG